MFPYLSDGKTFLSMSRHDGCLRMPPPVSPIVLPSLPSHLFLPQVRFPHASLPLQGRPDGTQPLGTTLTGYNRAPYLVYRLASGPSPPSGRSSLRQKPRAQTPGGAVFPDPMARARSGRKASPGSAFGLCPSIGKVPGRFDTPLCGPVSMAAEHLRHRRGGHTSSRVGRRQGLQPKRPPAGRAGIVVVVGRAYFGGLVPSSRHCSHLSGSRES